MKVRDRLEGYVRAEVTGSACGRFFNLCVKNGIHLWDVRQLSEGRFSFYAARKEIWDMHPYIRKCGVHMQIKEKGGWWFFFFRYRRRIAFPVALAAVVLLFGYASRFVWKIEVVGNSSLTSETIIDYLQKNGVGLGAAAKEVDCGRLGLALRKDFDQVIWASVSIEGTDMIIELQEKVALPEKKGSKSAEMTGQKPSGETADRSTKANGPDGGGDVVAAQDGQVVSIIARRGTPLVKAGDQVKKGQVLIRGKQDILDDSGGVKTQIFEQADGDVEGMVVYPYRDHIPVVQKEKIRGKRHIAALSLDIFGHMVRLPFSGGKKDTEVIREYHQLHLTHQFYLPVTLEVGYRYDLEVKSVKKSPKEAEEEAKKHLRLFIRKWNQKGFRIKNQQVEMKKSGKEYQVSGTITGIGELGTCVKKR